MAANYPVCRPGALSALNDPQRCTAATAPADGRPRRDRDRAAPLTLRNWRDANVSQSFDSLSFSQEIAMTDYVTDVRKYTSNVNESAVAAIVKHCGIALQRPDSSLVSASDSKELATIREGFAAKKLGLTAEAADAGIKAAAEKMKATGHKSRVTFYYLLAEATGTLSKLG
jgi:energy-coupling factor transporter ATP-binding protein EcfA2